MLILAIDIGTSSTRTALFDQSGVRIVTTTAQATHALITDRDGRAEIEPAALLDGVRACIGRTLAAARRDRTLRGRAIAGVATSCFWHSLVGTTADGRPLTRVITWADSRCRDDAARLRGHHDERRYHQRTGCMLRASFWPAKLAWLQRTEPRVFSRVARWMSPAEWLYLQLSSGLRCAHGMATGTGLYDPEAMSWDAPSLARFGVPQSSLSPIADTPLRLDRRWHRAWPEIADAAWYPAIGDGAANNLGVGATRRGWAAINFGTSGAVRILRDRGEARAPFGLFCYRVDARRFLVGGAISNAGSLRAWCLDQLRLPEDPSAIERALADRPGPDHGLRVLPFWLAERAPTWREDLRGAIVGLTQATSALDVLQATTEASFHRLATIIDLLPGSRSRLRIAVGGGIQKSRGALQRLADVLGREVRPSLEPESSLSGAAVLALERLRSADQIAATTGEPIAPRRTHARAYARERVELAALERTLYPTDSTKRTRRTRR
ncbi:MAG: gluconokinase [Planctomycetes bacterium]|nr:gluconokinase [Planctomycetota bacterium]